MDVFCLQKGWFVERWGFLVRDPEEVKKKMKNHFVALFRTSGAFWERQCMNFLGIFVWLVVLRFFIICLGFLIVLNVGHLKYLFAIFC